MGVSKDVSFERGIAVVVVVCEYPYSCHGVLV